MALTSNVWNLVTFKPYSDAAWTGYTPPFPDVPSVIGNAVVNGLALNVMPLGVGGPTAYIIADGMATPFLIEVAVLATDTPKATDMTVMDNGDVWYSMRGSSGAWLRYEQNANRVFTLASPVALGVFLS